MPRSLAIALSLLLVQPAIAQIAPDGTTPTTITTEGLVDRIQGQPLTPDATNLFHSFDEFSIPAERTVRFELPSDRITTILTRVTGENISQIEGTLRVEGVADLFLLNPNGIHFGDNSRVRTNGDLILTTADSIEFDDLAFSATGLAADPALLSVLMPTGLQFGDAPGTIVNRSRTFGDSDNSRLNVNSVEAPLGINVLEHRGLLVAGGDILLEGGNFSAIGGTISLASSGGGNRIGIADSDIGWQLGDLPEAIAGGTIDLSRNAIVDASGRLPRTLADDDLGSGGGPLQVFAQNLNVRDSGITTSSYGLPGSTLIVDTDQLDLSGTSRGEAAGIFNQPQGSVRGGDISIQSRILRLSAGSQISTFTLSEGDAGDLFVRAQVIELRGSALAQSIPTALETITASSGDAGSIEIDTNSLTLLDEAIINSSSFGTGESGSISIRARQSISIVGTLGSNSENAAQIASALQPRLTLNQSSGGAGSVSITTPDLTLDRGGRILTRSLTQTPGGDLTLNVSEHLKIDGGGNITIDTANGGGTLTLNAPNGTIEILGTDADGNIPSGIFTQIQNDGLPGSVAGDLKITADRLIVRDGGAISVDTFGDGNAGQLILNVRDIEVSGRSSQPLTNAPPTGIANRFNISPVRVNVDGEAFLPSRITGFTADTGTGGSLRLSGDRLALSNFARINSGVNALPSLEDSDPILSPAGDIALDFDRITLSDNASIIVNTLSGDAGNIEIAAADLLLDRDSRVAVNATAEATGGNLTIDAENLVALDNSDITATAQESFGGRIDLSAIGVFGATEFTVEENIANDAIAIADLTSGNTTSDITASSALGSNFSGTVTIDIPDIRPDEGLSDPTTLADVPAIETACDTDPGDEAPSLVNVGNGGLPPRAAQLQYENMDAFLGAIDLDALARSQLMEAWGWTRTADGHVRLRGELPTRSTSCPVRASR